MNLYIKIDESGNPVGHPILEENLIDHLEIRNLTLEKAKAAGFIQFEPVVLGAAEEQTGDPVYTVGDDGIARPSYPSRTLTQEERVNKFIRDPRGFLLARTDWAVLPDSPLDAATKTAYETYRQELRDLTSTYPDPASPDDIVWPQEP